MFPIVSAPPAHPCFRRRSTASFTAAASTSAPTNRRPNSTAATPLVPVPTKGSTTNSPGSEKNPTRSRNGPTDCSQGCLPLVGTMLQMVKSVHWLRDVVRPFREHEIRAPCFSEVSESSVWTLEYDSALPYPVEMPREVRNHLGKPALAGKRYEQPARFKDPCRQRSEVGEQVEGVISPGRVCRD